jgi:hypothetical protein
LVRHLRHFEGAGGGGDAVSTRGRRFAAGLGPMGQAPVSFFAPDPRLAVGSAVGAAAVEMKQLVAALHEEGIEVLLEVEYCFTAEGSDASPNPVSLQGLDADVYYR